MSESREAIDRLDRWVEQGLISGEQADAIREFERSAPPRDRLPPVAEAVAYLGILLAVAAAFALWVARFDDADDASRLGISIGLAVVLLVVGWPVGARGDPGMRRIGATLWLLGTIAVGFAILDGYLAATNDDPPQVTTFAIGVTMFLVGGGAYLLRREAATQVAVFLGAAVTFIGLPVWLLDEDAAFRVVPVLLLLLGAVWLIAGSLGRLHPSRVARTVGAITALLAPYVAFGEEVGPWLLVGSVVSAALLVTGVRLSWTSVAVLAGLGLFGYLTGSILYFFGETIGAPLALLLGAVVLLSVALLYARLRRRGTEPSEEAGSPPHDAPAATEEASESS